MSHSDFRIPVLPQTVMETLNLFFHPDPNVKMIAKVMGKDPGLTALLLRKANSAAYCTNGSTSDLAVAVARLGLNAVRQTLLLEAVEKTFEAPPNSLLDWEGMLRHMAFVGQLAFRLSKTHAQAFSTDLQVAGLIHDVGIFIYAMNKPQEMEKIASHAQEHGVDFDKAARLLKLPCHSELGQLAAKEWNLPARVCNLIAWHHMETQGLRNNLMKEDQELVDLLILADVLAHRFGPNLKGYRRDTRINPALLSAVRLDQTIVMNAVRNTQHYLDLVREEEEAS